MSEFVAIETQEAFDNAIRSRLEREAQKATAEAVKKYEGYISPDEVQKERDKHTAEVSKLTEKLKAVQTELDSTKTTLAEQTTKTQQYETDSVKTRVAYEFGLPLEFVDRLKGTTEEDIRKDAETLSQFTKSNHRTPTYTAEQPVAQGKDALYLELARQLKAKKE